MTGGYIDDPYWSMFTATGTLPVGTYVKLSTAADLSLLPCGAGDPIFGVVWYGSRTPPYLTLNDGNVAIAGEGVGVAGPGRIVPLVIGAAITRGDPLKSDASGRGVTGATTDICGAIALQSGTVVGSMVLALVVFAQAASLFNDH